jgi:phi13 family phage major tail protein
MANGRVLTGFSQPYVASYAATGTTVTYTSGQILARGVSVGLEVTVADDNTFYADNIAAESVPGLFQSGTCTLTVDGLLDPAAKLILGLPSAGADGFTAYGDDMNPPYVGVGFICRYMSDGVTSYVPVVLPKCRFNTPNLDAATQGESIEWQTQELTANILRDDTAKHNWKLVGSAYSTEALAASAIATVMA